jgi:antitoxin YefM
MQQRFPSGSSMDAIAYATAVEGFWELCDRVCDGLEAIAIVRDDGRSVVMMSLAEFSSLEETAFLLLSPKNAQRLLGAIAELEAGNIKERELLD